MTSRPHRPGRAHAPVVAGRDPPPRAGPSARVGAASKHRTEPGERRASCSGSNRNRAGDRLKGVPMMADVACFCGCLYSFHGDAGACPRCGEYATVMTAAASVSAGRSHQEVRPVLALISCPECCIAAEATDRFSLPGTDGPVDHVALRGAAGHHFRMPSDMLPTREQEQLPVQEQAPTRPLVIFPSA